MKKFLIAGILTAALVPAVPALAETPSPQDLRVTNPGAAPSAYTESYRGAPDGLRSGFTSDYSAERYDNYVIRRGGFAPRPAPVIKRTGPSPADLEVQR